MIHWVAQYTPRAREQRSGYRRTVRRLFDDALGEVVMSPWRADQLDIETSWFGRRVGRWGTLLYALPELGWVSVLECRWDEPAEHPSEHVRVAWRELAHADLHG